MSRQRQKPNTHRLWGRHPFLYRGVWVELASGNQKNLQAEKKIREMDEAWELKILPIRTIPSELQ